MQTIDMFLSRLHGDDQQRHARDQHGPRGEQLQAIRLRLRHEMTGLKERITKKQADPTLSPEGKRQAARELAAKTDLSFFDGVRSEAESDLTRYRTLLFATPKSDKSEVLAFLSEQEIRAKYADAPQHVILMAYQLAVTEGHYEGQRALTQGPLGSLVPAEFQERALLGRAEKSQPLVLGNYQQAQNMKEHLDSLHDQAQQVLHTLKDDAPVRAVA